MSEHSQPPDEPVAVATLEMQPGQRPCGALISADGQRRSFAGWVEFAVVIQDWRAVVHELSGEESGRPDGR
jgi:hypothetical protein